jgi:hypothetical protein
MDVDPPIKEEDLDIDTSFQFSNLPDNPIDLTPDDDDFGSDDDVRDLPPPPDSDSDSDSEYEPPSSPNRLDMPPVIVIPDSATPAPHGCEPPAPRRISDEDRAPGTPPGSDSDPENDPDNPTLTEGMRIRKQM